MLKNIQVLKTFLSKRISNPGQETKPNSDLSIQEDSFEYNITEKLVLMDNAKEARKKLELIRNETKMNDFQYIKILNSINVYFESFNETSKLMS